MSSIQRSRAAWPIGNGPCLIRKRGCPRCSEIALRSAKPEDQEIAQALFGAGEIVARVHRAEHVIPRHLAVERGDEALKSILADERINVLIVQCGRDQYRMNAIIVFKPSAMEFKERLREQVDIVHVVGDYVRLRRVGKRYSGLCPFHNEKTPSFSVSQEHQYFRCFGCDAKGDVFKFVELIEGLTFFEALKKLADQHGIALPKQSLASDDETRLRAALYEMHEIAANHFRSNLAGSQGERGAPIPRETRRERGRGRSSSDWDSRMVRAARSLRILESSRIQAGTDGSFGSGGPARRRIVLRSLPQPVDVPDPE